MLESGAKMRKSTLPPPTTQRMACAGRLGAQSRLGQFLRGEGDVQSFPLHPQLLRRRVLATGTVVLLALAVALLVLSLFASETHGSDVGVVAERAAAAVAFAVAVCGAYLLLREPTTLRVGHGLVGWFMGDGWEVVEAVRVLGVREAFVEEVRVCDAQTRVLARAQSLRHWFSESPHVVVSLDSDEALDWVVCGLRRPLYGCRRWLRSCGVGSASAPHSVVISPAAEDKAAFHHLVAHMNALVSRERDQWVSGDTAQPGAHGAGGAAVNAAAGSGAGSSMRAPTHPTPASAAGAVVLRSPISDGLPPRGQSAEGGEEGRGRSNKEHSPPAPEGAPHDADDAPTDPESLPPALPPRAASSVLAHANPPVLL
jgi:hypothetical protein